MVEYWTNGIMGESKWGKGLFFSHHSNIPSTHRSMGKCVFEIRLKKARSRA
jgi:hypothetical protein